MIVIALYFFKQKLIDKKNIKLEDLIYLYKGKTLNTDYETITSTKEPTVRQFKEWMTDIDDTLRKNKKKLLVIYDNIDRLQENKVKEVWSSIHTFFSEDDYDNIFVIIPFSKKHILTAFKGKDNEVNEGIIEKTFPVVYNVTPPVLVDWKNYFNENLELIFPNINEEDKNVIRTLYNKNVEKITPRGIKSFINELKVLNSVHTNIELKYISLFVLIKEKIQADFPNYFYGEEFSKYRRILGNDTDKKIIALYFGIDEKDAIQVLLEREMIKNLENGNFSKIDEQSQISGFNEVLQKVITDLYGDGELQRIYRKALVAIKNQKVNSFILDSFLDSFKSEEKTFSFQEYHKILLEKCSLKEEEIFKELLSIDFYSGDETQNIKSLCDELKELENYMKEKNYDFSKYIKVRKYQPVIFFQMLEEFKFFYEYYGISFIEKDMEDYLSYNLKSFSEKDMENLEFLLDDYNFYELKENLALRIQEDRENKVTLNEYKVFTKLAIKNQEKGLNLGINFNRDVLSNQLSKLSSNYSSFGKEKYYIISLILNYVSYNVNQSSSISNFSYILDSISDYDIEEIEKLLINYVEIDKLILMLKNYKDRRFSKKIIEILLKEKNMTDLEIENIIKEYSQIKLLIPNELKKDFFEVLNKFYNQPFNFDYTNIVSESSLKDILLDSKEFDLKLVKDLQELFVKYFNQENKMNFLYQDYQNRNDNVSSIYEIIVDNKNLDINLSVINEVKKILIHLIDNPHNLTEKYKNILKILLERIPSEELESTINNDIKGKILGKTSINFEIFKSFYKVFEKTKFFYFNEEDFIKQSKKDDYNKLIKVLILPYVNTEEVKEFILECIEFKNGLKLLKGSNRELIEKIKSTYKQDRAIQNFIAELNEKGDQ
ncbi:MAG: P-loop NTPase fold protein [Fusobacterium mortiferum]|nr:P-loop NTPase fold protein [Fusobacterium mortiferum]